MKKYLLLLIVVLIVSPDILSQNKLSLNIGYGYYLSNSENSMKIMGDESFHSFLFYGFSFENENVLGLNLMLEYGYHRITKNNVIQFVRTSAAGPEPIGFLGGDMSLISHNIDLDWVNNINPYFSYGIGPSVIIVNRIFEINNIPSGIANQSLYDKLASSGLGLNGFLMFNIPVDMNGRFFLNSRIKLRYTHSIWFDKGIRNLDNYYQSFFTGQISAGIGYVF